MISLIKPLTIRPAHDADLPAILELFKTSLGEAGGIPEESFWRWKHFDNPFGKSPTLLAYDDQKLVGLRTFLRWRFTCRGNPVHAYRAVDTATHPDYRGKGIFKKLTLKLVEELKSGVPSFIFNTPNAQSLPGYFRMGWQVAGMTPLYVRPWLPGLVKNRFQRPGRLEAKRWPAGFENAWQHLSPRFKSLFHDLFVTDYSSGYFKWRYHDIPGFTYDFYISDECIIVYRIKTGKFIELRIADIITGNRDGKAVKHAVSEITRRHRPDVVTILNDKRNIMASNLPSGFFSAARFGLTVTAREVNDPSLLRLFMNRSWALGSGTFELF